MLEVTRRRVGSAAWLALGLVVALPSLAEAQLFPNRTIKRQRESCAAEPPFNAHVRRDYFGYYPTCWSRFPAGWQCPCPNPELPDPAASFERIKRDVVPPQALDDQGMRPADGDRAMPDDRNPDDAGAPALPDPGRQPFRMDPRPDTPGRPTTPQPPDTSLPRASAPSPTTPPATTPAPSVGMLEMPTVPATTDVVASSLEPGSMTLTPEVTRASNLTSSSRDLGILPAASAPSASTSSDLPIPSTPDAPAQAPKRKGLLGGLFGSGNSRRR